MKTKELVKKLKKLGATVDPTSGKGGHMRVTLNGRLTIVPSGKGELPTGTLAAILRQLGIKKQDLR